MLSGTHDTAKVPANGRGGGETEGQKSAERKGRP